MQMAYSMGKEDKTAGSMTRYRVAVKEQRILATGKKS